MDSITETGCQCGYCLHEFDNMVKPKALPCGHVFCLRCLQNDFRFSPHLECIACRTKHEIRDLEALPPYEAGRNFRKRSKSKSDPIDHKHGGVTVKSQNIQENMDIRKSTSYSMCSVHLAEEQRLGCRLCHTALCLECLNDTKCPLGRHHEVVKIDALVKDLKSDLDINLPKLHQKSSRITEIEKNVLRLMEEKKRECEEMKAIVDEKMQKVKEEWEKLKSDIDDYYNSCAIIIEIYLADLSEAKDALELLKGHIHELKQQEKVTSDVILECSRAVSDAELEIERRIESLYLKTADIKITGQSMIACSFEVGDDSLPLLTDLTAIVPTDLKFLYSGADLGKHNSAKWVSVKWTLNEWLLCITDTKEIQCRDQDLNLLFSFPREYTLASPFGSDFLLLKLEGNHCQVELFNENFQRTKSLLALRARDFTNASSSDDLKFSANPGSNFFIADKSKIVLYDNNGNRIREFYYKNYFEDVITILPFCDNMFILASSLSSTPPSSDRNVIHAPSAFSNVLKRDASLSVCSSNPPVLGPLSVYRLNLKNNCYPEQICKDLDSSAGLGVDDSGYIYVTNRGCNTISIHSSAGKLQELVHEDLNSVGGLSIKGNKIAVACDKKIKIFKLL